MVEKFLGDEQAKDIFVSSMLAGLLTEKQAVDAVGAMEKSAKAEWRLAALLKLLGNAGHLVGGTAKAGIGALKGGVSSLGWLAALGAGTGALGATAYDVVKERTSQEDPEAQLNEDIEALYNSRTRELQDAKWLARVRGMRDELKRGYKKMSPEEYSAKYDELSRALDERRA